MKSPRYVITGAPSSGKTSTLQAIAAHGYRTAYDPGRTYIEERLAEGETLEQIRADNVAFQSAVLERRQALERSLPTDEPVFLDCGVYDNVAFLRWGGTEPTLEQWQSIKPFKYDAVFLLEFKEVERDHARTETNEDSRRMERLMREAYEEAGMEPVWIPWQPAIKGRAVQILEHLNFSVNAKSNR